MSHSEFTDLVELASGTLHGPLRDEIRAHLTVCAACSAEAETARRLLAAARADRMTDPPEAVLEAALSLWKSARPRAVGRSVSIVKAILSFDSFASPAAAAVRSTETSRRTARARRLVYRAGDYDIELTVERPRSGKERPSIRGQLLPRVDADIVPAGTEARLGKAGGRIARLALDRRGVFSSGPLPRGRYRLSLEVGASRLVVERLEVR